MKRDLHMRFKNGNRALNTLFVFAVYLFLAYIFHGFGVELFNMSLSPGDAHIQGIPARLFASTFTLWNQYNALGSFFAINPQNQNFYIPGLLISRLLPIVIGFNLFLLLHYAMAGFFTFLFTRSMGLNVSASFIGGVCFMFSGFLSAHKGHFSMVTVAVWLPLTLYLIERHFNERDFRFLLLASLSFGLSILAGDPAITIYSCLIFAPYLCFKVFSTEGTSGGIMVKMRVFALDLFIVLALGAMAASVQIFPVFESLNLISREKISFGFFSSYSFPFGALPLMFFPFLYGTHNPGFYKTLYFGPYNLTELAGYMGILPLTMAFLAFILFRKRDARIWFWALTAISGFILVLGRNTPLYKLMFHVPGYNMFRVPARNWFEVGFSVSILASFGVHSFMSMGADGFPGKALKKASVWLIAIAASVLLAREMVIRFLDPASVHLRNDLGISSTEALRLFAENTRLGSPAVYIPIIMIIASVLCLLALKRFYKSRPFWCVFAAVIFLDLFSFGHFHDNGYPDLSFIEDGEKGGLYDFLRKKEPDLNAVRMISLELHPDEMAPLTNLLYGLNFVNSYGPIWLKDYKELTCFLPHGVSSRVSELIENNVILSTLSTKYIMTNDAGLKSLLESARQGRYRPDGGQDSKNGREGDNQGHGVYEKRFESKTGVGLYENTRFLRRARFVEKVLPAGSPAEVNNTLWNDEGFDPSSALVEGIEERSFDAGEVLGADFSRGDSMELSVKTGETGFLVLSDTYYPGWSAFVDGDKARIYRTNGVMRGLLIRGKGEHKVEFVFSPKSLYAGLVVSVLTIVFVTGLIIHKSGK